MKNIAVYFPAMRMGGAEKVGIEFLKDLKKFYNVTVILNKKEGALLECVPNDIPILVDELPNFNDILKADIKKFRLLKIAKDLLYYIKIKLKLDKEKNHSYLIGREVNIKQRFDIAIGYVANVSTQIFALAKRISADKKIAWIHGETTELYNTKLFSKYFSSFDKMYCVSNVSREHFVSRFSVVRDKTDVYYNRIDSETILKKSKEETETYKKEDNILITTVARLTHEKGCIMIPDICDNLVKKGYNICWLVVGNGTEYDSIKSKIGDLHLENNIVLLGEQKNPYPYMKQADIYVQPSFEEGYSLTMAEAGILGKAIVGTNICGIQEEIIPNEFGLFPEPKINELAKDIERIIVDKELKEKLKTNILKIDFSHNKEIDKIKNFIG